MLRSAFAKSRYLKVLSNQNLIISANSKPCRGMASTGNVRDPNTLANYKSFLTSHVVANLNIDFDKRSLSGNVVLSLKCCDESERPDIFLDTSHLDIEGVKLDGEKAEYELLARVEPYGSALKIKMKPDHTKDNVDLDVGLPLLLERFQNT